MSEPYPLPAHAVYIWFAGESLMIGLPPLAGDSQGHTVAIPIDKCSIELSESGTTLGRQRGWEALLALLRNRAIAADERRRVTVAEETQWRLDAIMRHLENDSRERAEVLRRKREEAESVLKELGL